MDIMVAAVCIYLKDTLGDEEQKQLVSWKMKEVTAPLGQLWVFFSLITTRVRYIWSSALGEKKKSHGTVKFSKGLKTLTIQSCSSKEADSASICH